MFSPIFFSKILMVSNYDFSPKMTKSSLKIFKNLNFFQQKSSFFHQKLSFSERFQLKNKHFSKKFLPATRKTRGTKVVFEN